MKQSGNIYRSWIGDKVRSIRLPSGDYVLEFSAQGYVGDNPISHVIEGGEQTDVGRTLIARRITRPQRNTGRRGPDGRE